MLVCSSHALTAVFSDTTVYSKSLILKKTGQERPLEYNRLKYSFAVSCVAACRSEIKKLLA